MSELRWQFLYFHQEMNDEQVREIIAPYEPVEIQRGEHCVVTFYGGSYIEEAQMRQKLSDWTDALPKVERPPFDAESYLKELGIDPTEKTHRRCRDFSKIANTVDWAKAQAEKRTGKR